MKDTQVNEAGLSRRAFLGLGATAAVAASALGLGACAPAESGAGAETGADAGAAMPQTGATGNPTEFVPSFLNAPAPIDESAVVETIDTEVCVVGLGLAGVCALREAAIGKSVHDAFYNARKELLSYDPANKDVWSSFILIE